MIKKYAIFPGPVVSKNDGQLHDVGVYVLAGHYRIKEYIIVYTAHEAKLARDAGFTILKPRYDGNYTLDNE